MLLNLVRNSIEAIGQPERGLIAIEAVLAGADFGAGLWMLLAVPGRASVTATRDHARHAMGPVWEANHVWLIFVLVVCWTSYPVAFASIVSTLAAPLLIAAIGIIFALLGYYAYLSGAFESVGGRALPLGKPVVRWFSK